MDEKIYYLTSELNKAMKEDSRFIKLDEIEKKMNNEDSVLLLAYHKDMANNRYNDLAKYYKDDDEVLIKARKDLSKAVEELNSHPLVKEYLNAYKEVKMVIYEMNKIIFDDLKEDR